MIPPPLMAMFEALKVADELFRVFPEALKVIFGLLWLALAPEIVTAFPA